jgi:hypothetical protein
LNHLITALKMTGVACLAILITIAVGYLCYLIQETFGLIWTTIPLFLFIFGISYLFAWLGDIE